MSISLAAAQKRAHLGKSPPVPSTPWMPPSLSSDWRVRSVWFKHGLCTKAICSTRCYTQSCSPSVHPQAAIAEPPIHSKAESSMVTLWLKRLMEIPLPLSLVHLHLLTVRPTVRSTNSDPNLSSALGGGLAQLALRRITSVLRLPRETQHFLGFGARIAAMCVDTSERRQEIDH